jgi:uncharacterized membrane protein YgcG
MTRIAHAGASRNFVTHRGFKRGAAVVCSPPGQWRGAVAQGYIKDRKMHMKKEIAAAALAAALWVSAQLASAQTAPAGPQAGSPVASLAAQYPIHDYVNDYAGVLDPDTHAQVLNAVRQLEAQHKVHLNIVIVRTLNGQSVQGVSTAIANNWESRHTANQRSVQIFLDIDERKMRFDICQNLEKIITDPDAGNFQQDMTPMLHEGDYGRALLSAAQNLSDLLAQKEQAAPTANAPRPAPAPATPPPPQNPPPASN